MTEEKKNYTEAELLRMTEAELVDAGICPTCFNRAHDGVLFGDDSRTLIFRDPDIECFLVQRPRAKGHMCIVSVPHYHDMSEAPDELNCKIVRFAKAFMRILKQVYGCERVYFCTMCDGPNNHYHVQLIPRYADEKRGSGNFVKPRQEYIYDEEKLLQLRQLAEEYSKKAE